MSPKKSGASSTVSRASKSLSVAPPQKTETKKKATGKRPRNETPSGSAGSGEACCAWCQNKPADRKWAKYEQIGPASNRKDVPYGDACLQCFEFASKHFGHLEWSDFVEHAATEAGQEDVNEARSFDAGHERQFLPQDATSGVQMEVCVEQAMLILTAAEYKACMTKAPFSRMPKVPKMDLPKVGEPNELERVYCFADPRRIGRQAKLTTRYFDARHTKRLEAPMQSFERQGEYLLQAGVDSRAEQLNGGDPFKNLALPDLREHFHKVAPGEPYTPALQQLLLQSFTDVDAEGAAADGACAHVTAPSSRTEAAIVVSATTGTNLLQRSLSKDKIVDQTKTPPRRTTKSQGPLPSPGSGSKSGAVDAATDDAQTSEVVGPDDSASCVVDDDVDFETDMTKLKTSKDKLMALRAKLPVVAVMSGKSKLGRQERNARQYLANDKLEEVDQKLLRNHLKLVARLVTYAKPYEFGAVAWHMCLMLPWR